MNKTQTLGKVSNLKIKDNKLTFDVNLNKKGTKLLSDIAKAGDPMGILNMIKVKDKIK